MGVWIFVSSCYHIYYLSAVGLSLAPTMGAIGLLALMANMLSVIILLPYKEGDANVRSVWLCSRNDAINNIMVMLAAVAVWATQSVIPDLLVAILMASLFLWSASQIIQQAWKERALAE